MTPLHFPDGVPSRCPLARRDEVRVIDHLREQLAARPPFPQELWLGDPIRRRVAGVIAEAVEDLCDWPAGRLRPSDPFKLVMIEDVADVDVGIALDRAFGVELDPAMWRDLYDLSFGAAVEEVAARIEAAGGND